MPDDLKRLCEAFGSIVDKIEHSAARGLTWILTDGGENAVQAGDEPFNRVLTIRYLDLDPDELNDGP